MKKTLIISASALIGLATLVGGWYIVQPSGPAYAAGTVYRQAHFGGDQDRYKGRATFRGHRAIAMLCSDRRDRTIETVTGFVEGFINFTPEQEKPWKDLTEAVGEGSALVSQTCEKVTPKGSQLSAPENLARIETVLETGLSVVQKLRPAFANFYGSLSEKQQKALETLLAHRHGRGHGRGHR